MRQLDWIVLAVTLLFIVLYGIWKGRGSRNIKGFLLADRSMKWYTVALAIMATQASAITFTSTPGQAYADGMRFVQFYFGLPIAMVILCITAVPIYHKLGVYTAYEYLEKRFDAKTRVLTTLIFLVSRGLAAGITIYAPSLVLSVMLGVDIWITSLIIGGLVIIYTTSGGVKAVNHTDFFQLIIVMAGMCIALGVALTLLPKEISFTDALSVSAVMGKLNTVDLSLDFSNRYNVWSGIIGGMFVALAYFGTDQSQVQRYLTGESVTQSRLALLFNGLAKVPMQFFILFIGVMVFVFFQFIQPPLIFNPVEAGKVKTGERAEEYRLLEVEHENLFQKKSEQIREYLQARHQHDDVRAAKKKEELQLLQQRYDAVHGKASNLLAEKDRTSDTSDTNYIFLTFVLTYLPAGLVGLIFACIFTASMSSSSGELSALATTSIIDVYKRFIKREASEKHYLLISRIMMAFWGLYGIAFAQYAGKMGSLVEAVNILGSLFYGTMLGIFLLAFYFKSVKGTAAFVGALSGEVVVLYCFQFTSIAWLWYNVIGCFVVVGVGIILSVFERRKTSGNLTSL
ncbi:MAG: sodium:solute symporter [Ignavibacteriales bacterium]|nr:sodium:solute symporter [Ignavibacteriales bacterium]